MATPYFDAWAEAVKSGTYSSPSGTAGYTRGGSRFDYIYKSQWGDRPEALQKPGW